MTRKITRAATRIKLGLQDKLLLGNLDSKRDWGFAGDYVEAMWRMLQQDAPDDYVVATGAAYSVRDFVEMVFSMVDLDWQKHVGIDQRYFRPAEVDHLEGDATKASKALNWQSRTSLRQLAEMMVAADMRLARKEQLLSDAGMPEPSRGDH